MAKLSKKFKGKVVSNKMNKTIVVLVNSFVRHPKYGKYVTRGKKHKVHDPEGKSKMGDAVTIEECRPISKDKHFRIV